MNILWDFDGTLFNTYPAHTKIFKNVLGNDIAEEAIYKQLKISFRHAIEYFQLTKDQVETTNRLGSEISPADVPPFPYVEDILKYADKNVILTHKPRVGVDTILDYYGWNHYFKEIVTIDNGFPRKPDPSSYAYLHKSHQLDLVVGDRVLDILPGKQLGIKTCLFENNEPGADYYLNDYREWMSVLL